METGYIPRIMRKSARFVRGVAYSAVALAALCTGCKSGARADVPPPDASRPVLKTEAELAAEREQRIRAGEVTPTNAPIVAAEHARFEAARPTNVVPPPIQADPDALRGDILMVNRQVLTVAQILYPLRDEIVEARKGRSPDGVREALDRLVRSSAQQEVGGLLVYEQGLAKLEEPQVKALDVAVDTELNQRVARNFDGSMARLVDQLDRYGLTKSQFKEMIRRQIVVRSYTRDLLMPKIQIRREELYAAYEANLKRYSTPAARELLVIEAPFNRFLDDGVAWDAATSAQQAQARLAATRQIRAAAEALAAGRAFADVAREFSKGPSAEKGGSWGMIGAPMQPPYDAISKPVFEFKTGQVSAPIETESGWYLVGCGRIDEPKTISFQDAQDDLRDRMRDEKFNRLAGDYVLKLAREATISSLDEFIRLAVLRAMDDAWPRPSSDAAALGPQR